MLRSSLLMPFQRRVAVQIRRHQNCLLRRSVFVLLQILVIRNIRLTFPFYLLRFWNWALVLESLGLRILYLNYIFSHLFSWVSNHVGQKRGPILVLIPVVWRVVEFDVQARITRVQTASLERFLSRLWLRRMPKVSYQRFARVHNYLLLKIFYRALKL